MTYRGLCFKYGWRLTLPLGYFAPAVMSGAFNAASLHAGGPHLNVSQVFVNAALGMAAAFASHEPTNSVLRRKHVGTARGDKIVRRVQAAAYTLPLLFGSLICKVPDFHVQFRQAIAIEQKTRATEPAHNVAHAAYVRCSQGHFDSTSRDASPHFVSGFSESPEVFV
jgi:hypothetical protein